MEIASGIVGFLLTLVLMVSISSAVQSALARRADVSALDKGRLRHRRNTRVLWGLLAMAIAYSGLLRFLHTLTGIAMLDGSMGVALGLYICAHPAANAVNILFFERDTLQHLSEPAVLRWLGLNLLVLLAGWVVIFVGLRRLLHGAV